MQRIDRGVVAVNRALLIAALGAMSVIVFINVLGRYLTDYSIPWAEELARYLMIWMTFLGVGLVLRIGGHVAVDNLQEALPPRGARIVRATIVLLVAAFCVVGAWVGVTFVTRTWMQTTAVTEIPFAFVAAAVPTGMLLALWHLAAVARGYVLERRFEVSEDVDPEEIKSI
jgi:TRAP-type C4-dicarboxylate transport system permease small subunit